MLYYFKKLKGNISFLFEELLVSMGAGNQSPSEDRLFICDLQQKISTASVEQYAYAAVYVTAVLELQVEPSVCIICKCLFRSLGFWYG